MSVAAIVGVVLRGKYKPVPAIRVVFRIDTFIGIFTT